MAFSQRSGARVDARALTRNNDENGAGFNLLVLHVLSPESAKKLNLAPF
jgi:hypothetical protein